jgi:exopolyphosphatase/guanosine-5'-triphosphate,3'-diphosphate pyrophosphatase
MIRACIDIGTNSVKLLVVNVKDQQVVDTLEYQAIATRIGQGLGRTHKLLPEAIDRAVEVIESFKREAELLGADRIIPVATSAVRDAQNRGLFMQKVIERTGLKLLIVSGDEEAEFAFIGVCSNRPELRSCKLIVVDVGGGSSDFVLAQNGEIEDAFSIRAGFIRLTEAFLNSDPPTSDELQETIEHVKILLRDHVANVTMDERRLVGVGGTINLLAAILYCRLGQYAPQSFQQWTLQRNEIAGLLRYLSRMKLEERRQIDGLPSERADVIVAGAAIFSAIMETLNAKEIMISDRSMRHGILLSEHLWK